MWAFFDSTDPLVGSLAGCGLRFDLPDPVQAQNIAASAPGMDRDKPPLLR